MVAPARSVRTLRPGVEMTPAPGPSRLAGLGISLSQEALRHCLGIPGMTG